MALFRTYVVIAAAALAAVACSDDPFCGDGERNTPEEQCDDGNSDDTDFCLSTCKARVLSRLFVKWSFNSDPDRGFSGDSCLEMGARQVEVALEGGPGPDPIEPIVESCSSFQAAFVDIPSADYTIKLKVLDSDGQLIVNSPVEAEYLFSGGNETTEVVVPADAWKDSYLGDFFFRVSWGGATCDEAEPLVVEQTLSLVVNGVTVSQSTEDGAAMDGSAASACIDLDQELPQVARDVPFGPAQFKVQGHDDLGAVVYEEIFETFVGAGVSNPVLVFDVDLVPSE